MTCPHCGQDDRAGLKRADHRCADAATYALASAPADRRLRVALAVVEAWKETDDA